MQTRTNTIQAVQFPKALDFDQVMAGARKPEFLRHEYQEFSKLGVDNLGSVLAMGLLLRAYTPLTLEIVLNDSGVVDRITAWSKQLDSRQIKLLRFHITDEVHYFLEELESNPECDLEDLRQTRNQLESIAYVLSAAGHDDSISMYLKALDEKIESMFPSMIFENDEVFSALLTLIKLWLEHVNQNS